MVRRREVDGSRGVPTRDGLAERVAFERRLKRGEEASPGQVRRRALQKELRPVQTACGSCTCCSGARLGAAGGRAGGTGGGRAHHGPVGPVGSTGQRKEPESFSAPRRLRAEEADDRPYVFIGRTDEEACLRPHTRRGAKGRPHGSPWDGSALIAA